MANFICRFGTEAVLLDYAQTIVVPAFLDNSIVRQHGRSTYRIYDASVVELDEKDGIPTLGLCGHFIKNTELFREQIFDKSIGIVKDEQRMESAPSAFFVLILNNHRLLYLAETAYAPDLSEFSITVRNALRVTYRSFINQLKRDLKEQGIRRTKKELMVEHDPPTLEIVALAGKDDIQHFVLRYETLKNIDFVMIKPNDDIDAGEIFNQVRSIGDDLGSKRTKISAHNDEGLNLGNSIEIVNQAISGGNQQIRLSGVDKDGNALVGDNNNFRIMIPAEDAPDGDARKSVYLYGLYKKLIKNGAVVPQTVDKSLEKIKQIAGLWL